MAKKIFKIVGIVLLAVIVLAAALLIWLTATEYKPESKEDVSVTAAKDASAKTLSPGDSLSVLTWNVGYGGLGKGSEFFMDGGKGVRDADEDTVKSYVKGIYDTAYNGDGKADIHMFQEVDKNSHRTYGIDETEPLSEGGSSTFALNFSVNFIPYPIPPIGRVQSGLLTSSDYAVESAQRIALPTPFKWPTRVANLKRCLLVNYIPLEGSDKYLVMVDLHLEAYDSGEGKIAQTKVLNEFIQSEYDKGNYVIAGGDFNQEFPGALVVYPNTHKDLWTPGTLDASMIPDGWSFAYDTSTPSCRLLNQAYNPDDKENTQYYVIDGFIVSPNVTVDSVKTLDEGFANSDHNPVLLKATLNTK